MSEPTADEPRRALVAALLALLLWSSLAALGLRLRHVPPFFLVGFALLCGGLLGVPRLRWRTLRLRHLLLGVYGLFAYHLCLFLALRLAPPVEANLINYLWPLLLVVLAPWLVPGTSLSARHLLGASFGFGGAVLLVAGDGGGGSLVGHGLAFAAALIWSTYSLLTKRLGDVPTSSVAAFCLVSGALSLGAHFALEPAFWPSADDLPWLLAVGAGPMGAAFYLWDHAMKRVDPRVIGTLAYVTPLASTLLVAWVADVALTARVFVAAAAILGGAFLGSLGGGRPFWRRSGERS